MHSCAAPMCRISFGKVRVHPLTEKDPEEPTRSPFDRVRLTLHGRAHGRIRAGVRYPRGHFKRGVERDVLWQKFSDCADVAVDRPRARAAVRCAAEPAAACRAIGDAAPAVVRHAAE